MKKHLIKVKNAFLLGLFTLLAHQSSIAQSVDSRVCYCFTQSVTNDIMLSTKAIYGRVGVAVSRNMVLTPNQSQTVRFVLPTLPLNSNCQAQYALSIIDNNNQVLADRGNTNGEFNFNFSDCRKTYTVTLVASGRYTNGKSGGNCSRTITFSVKPTCR